MPRMYIDTDDIRSAAKKLIDCKMQQEEILGQVKMLAHDMFSDWKGTASMKFMKQLEALEPDYKKFAVDIEKFARLLERYADRMESLDAGGG